MIKIEVQSHEVEVKSGVSARTGKPYNIREQKAWAFLADGEGKPQPYPTAIRFALGDQQAPFDIGVYQLHPASLFVDRFGGLTIGRVALKPLAARVPDVNQKAA